MDYLSALIGKLTGGDSDRLPEESIWERLTKDQGSFPEGAFQEYGYPNPTSFHPKNVLGQGDMPPLPTRNPILTEPNIHLVERMLGRDSMADEPKDEGGSMFGGLGDVLQSAIEPFGFFKMLQKGGTLGALMGGNKPSAGAGESVAQDNGLDKIEMLIQMLLGQNETGMTPDEEEDYLADRRAGRL